MHVPVCASEIIGAHTERMSVVMRRLVVVVPAARLPESENVHADDEATPECCDRRSLGDCYSGSRRGGCAGLGLRSLRRWPSG